MENNILIKNHDLCTGCGICEAICPKNSIKIKLNEEGFYQPILDKNTCINCGLCIKTCAKFNDDKKINNYLEVYSFKNKNKEILKKSSSGGVSYELMKYCIENGYKILGASYDYKFEKTISIIEENKENLFKFFGSKYMQSYTVDSFKEVLNDKTDQKYAIFGTPCQIYALNKYVEIYKKREQFLFIDLFCHGCPSLNLWKKYLEDRKIEYKCNDFDEIEFRSKVNGWHEFSFKFLKDKKEYKTNKFKNDFYELFFDRNILNKGCYNCNIKNNLKYTDIRLGDFWGYQYDLDKEGVSAVVVCTDRGKAIINEIKNNFIIKIHNLNEILKFQSCNKICIMNLEKRDKIIQLLNSKINLNEFMKVYRRNYGVIKRIKINLKIIVKLFPNIFLRYFIHKYYNKNL